MKYHLKNMQIQEIIKYNLSIDSRNLKTNDIFFDFISKKNKKNPYLEKIIKKKPRIIFSERNLKLKNSVYKKNLKRYFLKILLKKYKKKPKNLIAVTGTNGKSSVAHFFKEINKHLGISCASIGTLGFIENKKKTNNNLTTPDILTNHSKLNEFYKKKIKNIIIETSSHGLDQGRLEGIVFKSGIFTNFTRDHLDYHKNLRNYLKAKLSLFSNLLSKNGYIITNSFLNKKYTKHFKNKKLLFGPNGNAIKLISLKACDNMSLVKINFNNEVFLFKTKLIGKIQIDNLINSILAAISIGIRFKKIINIVHKIRNPFGRIDYIEKKNKKIVIDYAHTPDGLKQVLKNLLSHFNKKIILVFGCGGDRDKKKRFIMGRIADKYCSNVLITDDNPRFEDPSKIRLQIAKGCKKSKIIPSREEAIKRAFKLLNNTNLLLITGKGHENYQIVKNIKKPFSDYKVVRSLL